jgi:hypothetical protein
MTKKKNAAAKVLILAIATVMKPRQVQQMILTEMRLTNLLMRLTP